MPWLQKLRQQVRLLRPCALCVRGSAERQELARPACHPPSAFPDTCTRRHRRTRTKGPGHFAGLPDPPIHPPPAPLAPSPFGTPPLTPSPPLAALGTLVPAVPPPLGPPSAPPPRPDPTRPGPATGRGPRDLPLGLAGRGRGNVWSPSSPACHRMDSPRQAQQGQREIVVPFLPPASQWTTPLPQPRQSGGDQVSLGPR